MGYIGRVGTFLGRQADWARLSGTLFLGTDHLVPKTVKYPDEYRSWKENPANWPTLAENFWFPPAQVVDPGWDKVHEEIAKGRKKKPKPVELPPGEEPL
jgi:hypothetical protein